MAAMKMRVNKDKTSECFACGREWKNTSEMYDLAIGHKKLRILPLCRKCMNELFQKTLKAERIYDSRIKSQSDIKRADNERLLDNGKIGGNPSTVLNGSKIKTEMEDD